MTHVWQHQTGVAVWLSGAFQQNYKYVLEPCKKLEDYGIEEQGNIVMDYYFKKNGISTSSWGSQSNDPTIKLSDLKNTIGDAFK